MTRFATMLLALLAAGTIAQAQTAKPAPKAPTPKAAPAKPAPKATPSRPAAAGDYDATNPQTLADLLKAEGAAAAAPRREDDSVFISVTSTAANFSLQFAGCNANGRACQGMLFDALLDVGRPTLTQINGFNQTSVVCRIYQDKQAKPHVTYAALLMKSDTPDSGRTHLAAWRGCLAEGASFVRDPNAYLATAP
ncbi:hypothetical protein LRS10_03355 [Phenylobacterium sp. J426]|uniref:hypothetical protein n=1 Tax=Phenylobacterium sp. J426 TaxID=2898439 RepID=UPI0021519D8B|nr:hypothetical protein [Phenylobacterium sp. J426]MCR5873311.1 hypothetical protein [Phenylobacterium sp. J426]